MKSFYNWIQITENVSQQQPDTISGAEVQIRTLAHNIRTAFSNDPKWNEYELQIQQATMLLDRAAGMLDDS